MLEQEVHLDAYPADIFEHVGELHIFWKRSKPIKPIATLAKPFTSSAR